MGWKQSFIVEYPAYQMLARLYDFVMRHVDYVEWADYVERIFRFYGPVPRRVFEAACGTGTLALELTARGYAVRGVDASEAMIAQAQAKAAARGPNGPSFSVGDMRDLPPDDADAVLCLYDSINYCLTEKDLRAALASFRRVVHEDALCIFDITTEYNSLRYFKDYHCRERHEEFVYERRSEYLQEQGVQINEFLFERNGSSEVVREVHKQHIYRLEDVRAAIPLDAWQVLGVFDGYTMNPADEASERIHLVLRAVGTMRARSE